MYINRLYDLINVLLNKDQRGKITVEEFNTMVANAQLNVYASILPTLEKAKYRKLRMQSASNNGDKSFHQEQLIEYYSTEKDLDIVGGKAELSPDVQFANSLFDGDNLYEKLSVKTFNTLVRSNRMKPSGCTPIYTLNNRTIKIYPEVEKVTLEYIRKAHTPKYTWTLVGGKEMFNPSASDFQDIDLPEILHVDILNELLEMSGLNLREQEVEAYAARAKQSEVLENR